MKRLRSNLTYANVIATLALFIALGGASYAAIKLPKNSVGTKQLKRGAVTPAKLSSASKSKLAGPKGATGAPGQTGPQGPKGERGEPATALWATVYYDGTLIRGRGAVGATRVGLGSYLVTFDRDVSKCNYQVTNQSYVAGGNLASTESIEHPQRVFVETANNVGEFADQPFYLAVFC